ncbi:ATP-binding cassette domain-containing protein [Streptococcus moroccensis]|uniref:ATP-binding cassette domain-containing protein n=1 Tax=Streptococcus moroccensis TaxID=1451356 RepID=UPI0027D7732D|nr:ATP-binding cassette domain-containing protein [Streptococcus moroccensis]
MLQTQDLTITHLKDLKDLVKDLTLVVNKGDKVALIGEEGNGKSTLLNLLMSPTEIASYASYSGTIHRQFSTLGFLPQSLPAEARSLSLNDYFFGDTMTLLDYGKLYRYASELSFDSDRFASNQQLGSLSGGEKVKVQLIKLFASDAEVFFLDEPSNDLDLDTLKWLEHTIQTLPQTVVFVSHDESLLSQVATKVVHLERIKKRTEARTQVQSLDYDDYKTQRDHQFAKDTKIGKKERKEHAATMAHNQQQQQAVQHRLRTTKNDVLGRLLAKKMKTLQSQERRFLRESEDFTEIPTKEDAISLRFNNISPLPASKVLLQLHNLKLETPERVLSQNIHLLFRGQDRIGIIGANGVGKSTLLNILYQRLQGRPDIKVAYMPQHYEALLPLEESPLEFLNPSEEKEHETKILSHLALLNFTREEARHPIAQLSGGQRAKLLLLNLVLQEPTVLLLDEPSRNISPTSQPELRQLFQSFPGAIVTISHDRLFLRDVCESFYELKPDGLHLINKDDLGH